METATVGSSGHGVILSSAPHGGSAGTDSKDSRATPTPREATAGLTHLFYVGLYLDQKHAIVASNVRHAEL